MISHYRVLRRLGAGGMGEVLLAQDTKLERSVAIKLMAADLAKDPNHRKRFHAEAMAASGLNHPNICVIHEVGETSDGRPFLAMEHIEGQTLEFVLQHRRVKPREVISLGAQVADALDAAHARGIVHRDIKPGNIMLDKRGQAKVLDFGLAKRFGAGQGPVSSLSNTDTATGFLVGTPHYMSPEQALGAELDQRSDIFSLGVLLYELVTGQRPFLGKAVGEIINKIVNESPRPLGLDNPRYTPALDDIIFKCLEKNPDKRYASAKALAEDLTRLLAGTGQPAAPAPKAAAPAAFETKLWQLAAKSKTNPTWVNTLAALVVVGLLATLVAVGLRARHAGSPTAPSRQRLVLLPFKSLASGEANEIFTDGLAVELFSKLSHIRGLQVIDGSGFVKSRGANTDLSGKWRELNAGALLQGTVLKEQKQLRIRLQLLDSQTQELLKAFDFDREPESVLALQTEAAEAIASALEVQLVAEDRRRLERQPTANPQAYQAFLQGRAFWNRITEPGFRRSIELFREAIERDPQFALAYAGIADSYVQLSFDYVPPEQAFAAARTNALRAIGLQPDLAEAHLSLAQCQMWFDRDYAGARRSFETALRLKPRHADTHHFFGHYHEMLGQMPRALTLLQKGGELDPGSLLIQSEIAWDFYHANRFEDAAAQCARVLATDPTFDYARLVLGWTEIQLGKHDAAMATLKKAWDGLGFRAVLGDLGYTYALAGKTREARDCLQQLKEFEAKGAYVSPSAFAFVHLGLGETDEAMKWFERAVEQHDPYMAWIKVEPRFDSLRNTPRFKALVQKLNLPE